MFELRLERISARLYQTTSIRHQSDHPKLEDCSRLRVPNSLVLSIKASTLRLRGRLRCR